MSYNNYSPAVKRMAEVTAFQDLTRVRPEYRWRLTPKDALNPVKIDPLKQRIPVGAVYAGHSGTDLRGTRGDPIYAVFGGKIWIAPDGAGWHYIHITTASGIVDRYYHCDTILVKSGQYVEDGQQIGTMGDKGKADGVHLHFNSTDINGQTLDSLPRLFGFVDVWNRELDPAGSARTPDGMLQLTDTDPYEVGDGEPVAYTVDTPGSRLNVRQRPGTNFPLAGMSIPDGETVLIDKWCNYDYTFTGDYRQSWGRLAGKPWHWVALRYGSWNVKRA